jgi:hypothetical protein
MSLTDHAAGLLVTHNLLLENHLEDFRDSNKKERSKIISGVHKEITEAANKMSSKEGRLLRKVSGSISY